jgi:UDP-N-acetylmuramate dehydrogenase
MSAFVLQENVDLRHLNTFHVSAKARYLVQITADAQLRAVTQWRQQQQLPYMLLGQGSNVLFKADYPGLIIELHTSGIRVVSENEDWVEVDVAAGERWHEFVSYALRQGWYGLENLSLIPGTVGAAPVQNIGAYGVEVKDHIVQVEALEVATGEFRRFSNADCAFSYRQSFFKQGGKDQFIICSVRFRLLRKAKLILNYPALQQALAAVSAEQLTPQLVSDTVCAIRRSKLPDPGVLGNAGSFFWNPRLEAAQFAAMRMQFPQLPGYADGDGFKVPAAWLIEQAGWKGYREGDVGVHKDHALVLVNYGEATGAELVSLSEKIQASVLAKFNVQLWPEVRII